MKKMSYSQEFEDFVNEIGFLRFIDKNIDCRATRSDFDFWIQFTRKLSFRYSLIPTSANEAFWEFELHRSIWEVGIQISNLLATR